jgi:basic amino acid/polyamine antiporter, APA family
MGLTFFTYLPVEFPGGDMILGLVLLTLSSVPFFVAYAMLAVSMPRSGGDYVFESRILHPALGFTLAENGMGIGFMTLGQAWCGWLMAMAGLAPMLIRLGMLSNNPTLTNVGIWFTTPIGLVAAIAALASVGVLTGLLGMRIYPKIQYVQIFFVVAAILVMYGILAALTPGNFVASMNSAMQQLGSGPNFVADTVAKARAGGYNPTPPFSWYNTIGAWAVFWGSTAWYQSSVWVGGEIKGATSMKNQLFSMLGALFAMNIGVYAIVGWLFFRASTAEFFNSFGWVSFTGNLTVFLPGVPPNIPSMTMLLTDNPILVIILGIGFIMTGYQIQMSGLIPQARTALAAAFDRIFPDPLADVNPRFHVPVKAYLVIYVLTILGGLMIAFVPWYGYFSATFTMIAVFLFTMVAAVVFPYRKAVRGIYDSSPIAKYKIGGIPAISVFGGLGLLLMLIIVGYTAITPYLIPSLTSWAIIGFCWALYVGIYLFYRWYRARQGIDIGLAFEVLPPE